MTNLEIQIRLQELITEREGYIAENKQRESLGQSMAYSDDSFFVLQSKMEELRKEATHDLLKTGGIHKLTGSESWTPRTISGKGHITTYECTCGASLHAEEVEDHMRRMNGKPDEQKEVSPA